MVPSLSAASLWPMSLQGAACIAAAAGFRGMEVVAFPAVAGRPPEGALEAFAAHNLELVSVHPDISPIPLLRARQRQTVAVRLAERLGTKPLVVLHMPGPEASQQALADFHAALDAALAAGLTVGLENVTLPRAGATRYLEEHLHPLVELAEALGASVTLDTGHAAASGLPPHRALSVVRPRLRNLHLSDTRSLGLLSKFPLVAGYLEQHERPGKGKLGLGGLLAELAASGYSGPVTVEVNPLFLKPWRRDWLMAELSQIAELIAHHAVAPHAGPPAMSSAD